MTIREIIEEEIGSLDFNGEHIHYGLGYDRLIDNHDWPIGWLSFIEARDEERGYVMHQVYYIEVDFASLPDSKSGSDITTTEHRTLNEQAETVARNFLKAIRNNNQVLEVRGVTMPTLEYFMSDSAFGVTFKGTIVMQDAYAC